MLAAEISWLAAPLRGADSRQLDAETSWRIRSRSMASFALGRIEVEQSPWQQAYVQTVKRLRVEHTFGSRLNLRAIYQRDGIDGGGRASESVFNLLLAWPLSERTALHLVAGEAHARPAARGNEPVRAERSIAMKVSHAFSF